MKNYNLFSTDDLPEYDIITDEDIKREEKALAKRAKQITTLTNKKTGKSYFTTCKHCGFTYMPMSEKTTKECPKCKGSIT